MKSIRILSSAVLATVFLSSPLAFSGGFEKPVFFSGHWGPVGGAAASAVSGAEALFFNPAGLAGGDSTIEATGDFSPTIVSFSGPLAGNGTVSSSNSFVPSFGAFANYKINSKWGVGIGAYLAGGSRAIYNNVSFTNVFTTFPGGATDPLLANSNATIQNDVNLVEFSIGTGYEILDGLRIGLDYRISMVSGAFSSYLADPTKGLLVTSTVDSLSGTGWNGFKLGAQYYPKESRWGAGAVWRTPVNFTATGNVSGQVTPANATGSATLGGAPAGTPIAFNSGGTASASNVFPQAFDLGGHYDIIPNGLRMHLQWTFTNYSVDQTLAIAGGSSIGSGATALPINLPNVDQNWHNENDLRVGFECFEVANWVFRASYIYSSQVTPDDRARATFTPPGSGHTFALGAGTNWMNNALTTDLALEYGFSSATTTGTTPTPDMTAGVPGSYWADDLAAHIGVTYRL